MLKGMMGMKINIGCEKMIYPVCLLIVTQALMLNFILKIYPELLKARYLNILIRLLYKTS